MKKLLSNLQQTFRGRGAGDNPDGRFEARRYEEDAEGIEGAGVGAIPRERDRHELPLRTEFFPDHSKTILAQNHSPDLPFRFSLNPYRGCEHGCVYCYARPTHEYMGLSAGLDFESKIFVKHRAPALLRQELSAKSWEPQLISISGVTDCYQPAEKKFQLTRQCLEVLGELKNPAAIVTKNRLITRDLDVLTALAKENLIAVFISVTTLDSQLARILEPRAVTPRERIETIEVLSAAGIPTGVMVAPVIPALNDMEIPAILHAAARAGAKHAGYVVLRLPYGVKDIFSAWLERHYPDRKEKILHRIEALRGGKLNDSQFGKRMRGAGIFADQIGQLFDLGLRKAGIAEQKLSLATDKFHRPKGPQLDLF